MFNLGRHIEYYIIILVVSLYSWEVLLTTTTSEVFKYTDVLPSPIKTFTSKHTPMTHVYQHIPDLNLLCPHDWIMLFSPNKKITSPSLIPKAPESEVDHRTLL